MIVRPLHVDEIPLVFPIGDAFGKEAGVEWDPAFFGQFWRNMYSMYMGVILGLFDWSSRKGTTPIADFGNSARTLMGSLGALVTPEMFSGKLAATEAWWYVFPEHRQGHGILLLDAYEKWAAERGATSVAMAHLQNLQPEKLAKLYELRGYKLTDCNYRKEI